MKNKINVGVVIGRFQVDQLHEGHEWLLRSALHDSDYLIVVLGGKSNLMPMMNNPLSFTERERLFINPETGEYTNGVSGVLYLNDHPSDEVWSQNLDDLLLDSVPELLQQYSGTLSYTLFHSRDSFKPYYSGNFATKEIPERGDAQANSGTSVRARVRAAINEGVVPESALPGYDLGYRHGAIAATGRVYPSCYTCVDVLGISEQGNILAITKKLFGDKYHMVGGFTDPTSHSNEEDAARELFEETGISVNPSEFVYVGSSSVDDWRYKSEDHKIRTNLMVINLDEETSTPIAGDDADTAQWVPYLDFIGNLNQSHQKVLAKLMPEFLTLNDRSENV